MENNFDTIVAIATPMAQSAIGIIRVSGESAYNVVQSIFSKKITPKIINHGYIVNDSKKIDEVIVLPFLAPHSFTGEDVIEIQTHGSISIINTILELILSKGVRMAQRGEFTKRAFLNHRIDLSQAEAINEIITSKNSKSAETALNNLEGYLKKQINIIKSDLTDLYSKIIASIDFPEDVNEIESNYVVSICNDNIHKIEKILNNSVSHDFIRDGINACLIGKPNVGKSSLFNSLLNYTRAIVTPIEGTTRDTIKETINLNGYMVNFSDTAGIRDELEADFVEKIGIENSIKAIENSNIVLFLFENNPDEIEKNLFEKAKNKEIILVKTKSDISRFNQNNLRHDFVEISSLTGFGIDKLKEVIYKKIIKFIPDDISYTANKRQQFCLNNAKKSLANVMKTAEFNCEADLFAMDLKSAIIALDEITGEVFTDTILDDIFSNFCIGK